MKQELTKKQNTIATVILIGAIVFLYKFYKSENAPAEKKEDVRVVEVVPFFTLQKNTDGFYTPENYLLDYYASINKKDWNYLLQHTLKNHNLNSLKGQFDNKRFVGVKVVSIEKPNKEIAFVSSNITYVNSVNDTIYKNVKAQLQLATDYQTWIVAPLTVY